MARTKGMPMMMWEDPKRFLPEIANALNQGSSFDPRLDSVSHARLLRLVRAWKESGPNLLKMKVREDDNATFDRLWDAWRCRLAPTSSGRASVFLSPTGANSADVVAVYFIRLILSPDCEKLGGPCPNCDKWFPKKTKRKSVFCSRACAGNATKANARAKKHNVKLDKAMRAIKNYKSRPSRFRDLNWKEYVSQAAPVSEKWLTRAITFGELVPPPKEVVHAGKN
jgi:hypothetical protein